jgi:protein gp37
LATAAEYIEFHKERIARFGEGEPRTIAIWNDFFHEDIEDDDRNLTIVKMRDNAQHTFIIITKRAIDMLRYCHEWEQSVGAKWPPNVVLGVTAELQARLDERVPYLLQTHAACRMLSLEPLLEEIDLEKALAIEEISCTENAGCKTYHSGYEWKSNIDWVVVGCETGQRRRPCDSEWVRSIVKQCRAASVPVFVKALNINGKVSKNMAEWPTDLQLREFP